MVSADPAQHLAPLDRWPSVSAILPVRNEEADIADAIRSIWDQDYPGDVEIVVADGDSEDQTVAILESLAATGIDLKVVANPAKRTPAGLNRAIASASGDVIVRCDGHAKLRPGYIRRAVEVLIETGASNVGGIQHAVGRTLGQRAVALAMTSKVGVGNSRFHYGGEPGPSDTVYLGVFRSEVFDLVGDFDESMIRNQDYELNHRIRERGLVVYFHPDLVVDYYPRASLKALWRQYWDYGRFKRLMLRKHPASLKLRQLAPPLLVMGLVGSVLLALVGIWEIAIIAPTTYLLLLLVTPVLHAGDEDAAVLWRLPATLAVMHLAWGSGFVIGR